MKTQTKAYLALAFICIVWGTTYLAMRVGVSQFPAFAFSAIRQTIAGGGLLLFVWLSGKGGTINAAYLKKHAFIGLMMITIGNGLVGWAEMFIPSGLAALICAMMPVCVVLINLASKAEEKPNALIYAGLAFGVAGLMLVFREHVADLVNPDYRMGILLTFVAIIGWSYGSVTIRRYGKPESPLMNAGFQLFFGGIGIWLLSFVFDDYTRFSTVDWQGMSALLYVTVFGSLGAFVCYLYVLQHLPVGLASIYAYVNPLVAVLLGWWILDEKLNALIALAFVITVVGIFMVNKGYKVKAYKALSKPAAT
ncbi:MAG: EamA family transporter [Imperialibacter sp.]|uniref:DMT family transporter n=1 Tax=Imperialibacter sp. TaxID=2038411 RepID=UPI0032EAAEC8